MLKLTSLHFLTNYQSQHNVTMDITAGQLLKGLEELTSLFNNRMSEFERSLQQPGAKESSPTIKSLAAEYNSFKSFVCKSLTLLKSQIELVFMGLDRLDAHSRRKVLLFHGIKEDADEDVLAKVVAVLSTQMQMSTLQSKDIDLCHRLGPKKGSARPVLVRFSSLMHCRDVWKNKTALKGSKVTVSEFLTKVRQEVFVAARQHFGVKRCWSADGVIVVLLPDKTRKKIFSMGELRSLMVQNPTLITK